MLYYSNQDHYHVYIEEDGDDVWVSVHNGYCRPYDCIVGTVDDGLTNHQRVKSALYCFSAVEYVKENLSENDTWQRKNRVLRAADEIEDALARAVEIG